MSYQPGLFRKMLPVSLLMVMLFMAASELPDTCWAESELFKERIQYQDNRYRVGPGDILSLQVLHEPDYKQDEMMIRPDGTLSIIGLGEMNVSGKTMGEISETIQTKLSETLNEPQVTLSLLHTRPATIYLAGAVMHPGMFQFNSNATDRNFHVNNSDTQTRTDLRLSNVLANAGGVRMNADLAHIQVKHEDTGEELVINLWDVLKGKTVGQDVLLHSGDSLFIPESAKTTMNDADYSLLLQSSIGPKTFPVRVIGETRTPGVYMLNGDSPYLSSAIAMSGGYSPQANRKMVAIRRFNDEHHFVTLSVQSEAEDIQLRPNDVVFISENRSYIAGRFMEQAAKFLSPFQSMAMTTAGVAQTFGLGGWAFRRNVLSTGNTNTTK